MTSTGRTDEQAAWLAASLRECRDYDPSFKLHGCELGAGHDGPHRDFTGYEWDEHLPAEPGRCDSDAPWGSGWRDQRCTLDCGHCGPHRDRSGNEWDNEPPAPARNPAADPERRAAFIAGLLDLACFLEANPDLPVQRYGQKITLHTGHELPHDGTWEGQLRALKAFARAIGAEVTETRGHYHASREFGPVTYEAVAISPAAHARFDAAQSYCNSITLDDDAAVAA